MSRNVQPGALLHAVRGLRNPHALAQRQAGCCLLRPMYGRGRCCVYGVDLAAEDEREEREGSMSNDFGWGRVRLIEQNSDEYWDIEVNPRRTEHEQFHLRLFPSTRTATRDRPPSSSPPSSARSPPRSTTSVR